VEAAAGDRLDLVEHELAVAEGVEHRRQGADLHAHVAEEQVRLAMRPISNSMVRIHWARRRRLDAPSAARRRG
jgi:hypothetical protein